jgi:hypothetical protein
MYDAGEWLAFAAVYEPVWTLVATHSSAEGFHALRIDVPIEIFGIETDFATYANRRDFTALPEASDVPGAVVQVGRCAF